MGYRQRRRRPVEVGAGGGKVFGRSAGEEAVEVVLGADQARLRRGDRLLLHRQVGRRGAVDQRLELRLGRGELRGDHIPLDLERGPVEHGDLLPLLHLVTLLDRQPGDTPAVGADSRTWRVALTVPEALVIDVTVCRLTMPTV